MTVCTTEPISINKLYNNKIQTTHREKKDYKKQTTTNMDGKNDNDYPNKGKRTFG